MELCDSQYDNAWLNQIAKESPSFRKALQEQLEFVEECGHEALWLGSFMDDFNKHTQVQLIVTQTQLIDEN